MVMKKKTVKWNQGKKGQGQNHLQGQVLAAAQGHPALRGQGQMGNRRWAAIPTQDQGRGQGNQNNSNGLRNLQLF
jgi:hypothetical protein